MITAIIIEDDIISRTTIKNLLASQFPEIKLLSEMGTVEEANNYLRQVEPDLIFLDVEMPDGLGIELECFQVPFDFDVVFCTGESKYAVDAFRLNATDFILKPVKKDDFVHVVKKIIAKRLDTNPDLMNYTAMIGNQPTLEKTKILLSTQDGIDFIELDNIIYCRSVQNYTEFYLSDDRKILTSKTLKEYDMMLSNKGFIRIHQSFLVNREHITKYVKGKGGSVIMSNGDELDVSQNKKEDFLQQIKQIFLSH